jgi:hypothetical protein
MCRKQKRLPHTKTSQPILIHPTTGLSSAHLQASSQSITPCHCFDRAAAVQIPGKRTSRHKDSNRSRPHCPCLDKWTRTSIRDRRRVAHNNRWRVRLPSLTIRRPAAAISAPRVRSRRVAISLPRPNSTRPSRTSRRACKDSTAMSWRRTGNMSSMKSRTRTMISKSTNSHLLESR